MVRLHTAAGRALDQSTLHRQRPSAYKQLEIEDKMIPFSKQNSQSDRPEEDTSHRQFDKDLACHCWEVVGGYPLRHAG